MKKLAIGGHHSFKAKTHEYLTPPEIIRALGDFDLDPCASKIRPWNTAKIHYTIDENGLYKRWQGRVWMNPPYGNHTNKWLSKLALHGNGIALIFARTETNTFFNCVWDLADGLLFIKGRIHFYDVYGHKYKHNSGAPSVLVAYGDNNVEALKLSGIDGAFIHF